MLPWTLSLSGLIDFQDFVKVPDRFFRSFLFKVGVAQVVLGQEVP